MCMTSFVVSFTLSAHKCNNYEYLHKKFGGLRAKIFYSYNKQMFETLSSTQSCMNMKQLVLHTDMLAASIAASYSVRIKPISVWAANYESKKAITVSQP